MHVIFAEDDRVKVSTVIYTQVGKVSVADEKAEAQKASGTNGAQNENTKDAKE